MEAGVGPETYVAAAAALTMLSANFEIQQGVLLAHTAGMDVLWPGLTVAARQAKITAYSGWLQSMVAECSRLSAACSVVAASYTMARGDMIPSAVSIQNRIAQATAVATNFCGINQPIITFLDTNYVEHWTQNATQMNLYDAQVITASAPVPKIPPPPLVNPAEPAMDAAQDAVSNLAQNTAGSVANQHAMDHASQFMEPAQEAMSAPQKLLQPFQQAFSAPQQMAQQLLSSVQGMGNGMGSGAGDGLPGSYIPFATNGGGMGSPLPNSGIGGGRFASAGGGVSGLRPALTSAAAPPGEALAAMSSTQSLTGRSKTAVPASSSALPGTGMGGLGGAGMRGKEETTTRESTIEAGVAPIADTDTARANVILSQWLPRRSGGLD
jgi:PPE-repeat protein